MDLVNKYLDLKLILQITILSLVYFSAAFIGLNLDAVAGFASLVWAPTGIALASIFLFGFKLWPGVFIGAFFSNLFFSAPANVAAGIAIGNTLEALIGVFLLKKFALDTELIKLRDVLIFLVFGVLVNTLVSALIGTVSLSLGQIIDDPMRFRVWFNWWVGDMLGALIVAPAIFIWFSKRPLRFYSPEQKNEFTFWAVFFTLTTAAVFFSSLPETIRINFLPYLVLPSIIWLAIRFNRQVVATALFLLAAISVSGTALGLGPFGKTDIEEGLILSQFFLGVISLSILIFGSEVNSRREAEHEVTRLNKVLEAKIGEEKRINKLMVEHIRKQSPKVQNSRKAQTDIEVN